MTTKVSIPPEETAEECVGQIANFNLRWQECDQKAAKAWRDGDEATGDKWAAIGSRMLDAEVAYTLRLKELMLEQRRYFIETTTHTAWLDDLANSLTQHVPVIERKQ